MTYAKIYAMGLVGFTALSAVGAETAPELRADLVAKIEGLTQTSGHLAYALFASKKGFPTDHTQAIHRAFVEFKSESTDSPSTTLTIKDLPAGNYALIVYEDLNKNKKLDKNFLGIPSEPVGASNNPTYHFGPPTFKNCQFSFDATKSQTISIKMVD
jgi:4,4'-diapolycopenoate synthase